MERYASSQWDIEGQVGLLAISLSNVVIISLYAHEVNRNNASNLPLLDRIIKVYLKMTLSQKMFTRPIIIFTIRDYYFSHHGDKKLIMENLTGALTAYLENSTKASTLSARPLSLKDLFQIQVEFLPPYLAESSDLPSRFFSAVEILSTRYYLLYCRSTYNDNVDFMILQLQIIYSKIRKRVLFLFLRLICSSFWKPYGTGFLSTTRC